MDRTEKELLEAVYRRRDEVVELCRGLVAVPSENPPGDTTAIAEHVAALLRQRNIPVEIIAPQPAMPNVVATVEGNGPGRHLVFNGHLDTFPVGDRGFRVDRGSVASDDVTFVRVRPNGLGQFPQPALERG